MREGAKFFFFFFLQSFMLPRPEMFLDLFLEFVQRLDGSSIPNAF
jgi:hypothetical protein